MDGSRKIKVIKKRIQKSKHLLDGSLKVSTHILPNNRDTFVPSPPPIDTNKSSPDSTPHKILVRKFALPVFHGTQENVQIGSNPSGSGFDKGTLPVNITQATSNSLWTLPSGTNSVRTVSAGTNSMRTVPSGTSLLKTASAGNPKFVKLISVPNIRNSLTENIKPTDSTPSSGTKTIISVPASGLKPKSVSGMSQILNTSGIKLIRGRTPILKLHTSKNGSFFLSNGKKITVVRSDSLPKHILRLPSSTTNSSSSSTLHTVVQPNVTSVLHLAVSKGNTNTGDIPTNVVRTSVTLCSPSMTAETNTGVYKPTAVTQSDGSSVLHLTITNTNRDDIPTNVLHSNDTSVLRLPSTITNTKLGSVPVSRSDDKLTSVLSLPNSISNTVMVTKNTVVQSDHTSNFCLPNRNMLIKTHTGNICTTVTQYDGTSLFNLSSIETTNANVSRIPAVVRSDGSYILCLPVTETNKNTFPMSASVVQSDVNLPITRTTNTNSGSIPATGSKSLNIQKTVNTNFSNIAFSEKETTINESAGNEIVNKNSSNIYALNPIDDSVISSVNNLNIGSNGNSSSLVEVLQFKELYSQEGVPRTVLREQNCLVNDGCSQTNCFSLLKDGNLIEITDDEETIIYERLNKLKCGRDQETDSNVRMEGNAVTEISNEKDVPQVDNDIMWNSKLDEELSGPLLLKLPIELTVPEITTYNISNNPNVSRVANRDLLLKIYKDYVQCVKKDNNGNYLIHLAVQRSSEKEVKKQCLLLNMRGITVDLRNYDGYTALHLAAQLNYIECLKILLKYGASPSAVDQNGCNAFEIAVIAKSRECKDFLNKMERIIDPNNII